MEKPPWSGQIVRPWVRWLAWVFVFMAFVAGVFGVFIIVSDGGIPAGTLPTILAWVIGEIYFVALLVHVGIKGVAPSTWWPWK